MSGTIVGRVIGLGLLVLLLIGAVALVIYGTVPEAAGVVVDGADRLREGAKVEVVTRDAPVPASPDAARRGPRGKDGAERPAGARNSKAKGA